MDASIVVAPKNGYFIKRFLLSFLVLFSFVYLGNAIYRSFMSHQVRFEEYYTHEYSLRSFLIESKGVHGSGADLDGYYANVSYKGSALPIRFTDYNPQGWHEEFELLLLGLICLFFSVAGAAGVGLLKKSEKETVGFKNRICILAGLGATFFLFPAIPFISFGLPYINIFVAG